jgi:hypothetical protein
MAAAPPPRNTNRYANGAQAVHQAWNRVCDAWNTVIYASQILRVLQEEEDSSVDLLCRRLDENEPKLLQLGWMMVGDYYTTKELDELVQAMIHNTSVTTISIGWSLRPYSIHRMLGAVVNMPQVENLSLVLHTSLRAENLECLKRHHPNLKRLQIQNVQLRRRCLDGNNNNNTAVANSSSCMLFSPRELWFQDYNIVELVGDWHQLDTLQLLDCDLQDYQIAYLTQKAQERPKPWNELSVAYNPHVGMKALVTLIRHANARRLDMTSCNITPPGARRLAKALMDLTTEMALKSAGIDPSLLVAPSGGDDDDDTGGGVVMVVETSPLESLSLAHNVYMGYGVLPLITAASKRLKRLDISHCQLPVQDVWEAIRRADDDTESSMIVLEHLSLQGYSDYPGLKDFLRYNIASLQTLQLSSSSTSTPITKATKQELLTGMASNYFVQEVVVFVGATTTISQEWWNFDFALSLNRIGRCILHNNSNQHTTTKTKKHWSHVLERASTNPDCLYWLLRNGVGNWNTLMEPRLPVVLSPRR